MLFLFEYKKFLFGEIIYPLQPVIRNLISYFSFTITA